jgi:hypothetical protein
VTLLPFFEWCEASWIGDTIRMSQWLFPAIEAVHLLALCVLGGSLLITDLRMLGVGLRAQPIEHIARAAKPWLVGSIAVLLVTGVGLFSSEAIKCYYNQAFWVKITTLPIALVYTSAVRERVAGRAEDVTATTRIVALISLALWLTVAAAGRWIGFS